MARWLGGGGGGGGGANPRTFAYLSVFSSLLVIMRRNTGLPPQPHRHCGGVPNFMGSSILRDTGVKLYCHASAEHELHTYAACASSVYT